MCFGVDNLAGNRAIALIPVSVVIFQVGHGGNVIYVLPRQMVLPPSVNHKPLVPGIRAECVVNAVPLRHVQNYSVLLTSLVEDSSSFFFVTHAETLGFIEYRFLALTDIKDNAPNDICGITRLQCIPLCGAISAAFVKSEGMPAEFCNTHESSS